MTTEKTGQPTEAELIARYGLVPASGAPDTSRDAALIAKYGLQSPDGSPPVEEAPAPVQVPRGGPYSDQAQQGAVRPPRALIPAGPRARSDQAPPLPPPTAVRRGIANLYPEGSAGRERALQQYDLPPSSGIGENLFAELIGESPVWGGALAGAKLGALSPIPGGTILGGGLGALGGSFYRSMMGLQSSDELTPSNVMTQAVPQATRDMAFELGGMGLGAWLGRLWQMGAQKFSLPASLGGRGGLRGTVDMPEQTWQQAAQNYDLASQIERRTGIPYGMTPGELMADPRIMDVERQAVLRSGTAPDTGEAFSSRFQEMLNARSRGALDIMDQFNVGLPPPGVPVDVRRGFSALPKLAQDTIETLYAQRDAMATPLYDQALGAVRTVNVKALERNLTQAVKDNSGRTRKALKKARDDLQSAMSKDGQISSRFLHNWQSDLSSEARRLGRRTAPGKQLISRAVMPSKTVLNNAVPGYKDVTNKFAQQSQYIENFQEKTALGAAAGAGTKARAMRNAGRQLVAPETTPGEIRNLKREMKFALRDLYPDDAARAGREFEELWGGYKAAFIQSKLNRIRATGTALDVNVPQKVGQLFGSDEGAAGGRALREQLKEVLTREEYAKLQLFQRAFRKTADLYRYGSATAGRQQPEAASPLVQAGVEAMATGGPSAVGVAGAWNVLTRSLSAPYRRFMAGGQAVEDANALAVLNGLEASMSHLRRLNRDLQRINLKDPVDIENATARLWGAVMGSAAENVELRD